MNNCTKCIHSLVCNQKYLNLGSCKLYEKPRTHGEWDKEDVRLINYLTRKCLECGKNSAVGNFCMWCGADMRKEGEYNE